MKKVLSLFLVLVLLCGMMPVSAFAMEETETIKTTEDADATEEADATEVIEPTETMEIAEVTEATEALLQGEISEVVGSTELTETTTTIEITENAEAANSQVTATPQIIHEHVYEAVVTAPTCDQDGYTTYTCECNDSYTDDYVDKTGEHTYENGICTGCEEEHPNLRNYRGKVISILGDSISTFAGYIPKADEFNLEHYARYPQDNLFTDVKHTWWMQVLTALDAKLGINDSWRSTEVYNNIDAEVNDSFDGTKACMASTTRIQNLGSNGTPDVILFYGGTNDITQRRPVGNFVPVTQVDLTSLKWETVAEAYTAAIMRMQHYYPKAEIIAMLPTFTSNNSDEVIEKYNSVLAEICNYYGVTYIDLRECGITTDDLPDGTHPGKEGMDYITAAVLDVLLRDCNIKEGNHIVHSVTHNLSDAKSSRSYYKGVSHGKSFTTTITGENVTVKVTMGGTDITDACYHNGVVSIDSVTADLVITASGKESTIYADHLQQLPSACCPGVNLWAVLEPESGYFKEKEWVSQYYSVTIPVAAGDQLWATSFQAAGLNGNAKNGVRLTWFDADGVLKSMSRDDTYGEFTANGYLTAPEGAIAANVVMWDNSESNELYMLNRDHIYEKGICTACDAEHDHDWSDWTTITQPSSDGPGMENRVCSGCGITEERERNGVWQTLLSGHMAAMPEAYCSATNLWAVLEPESEYFKDDEWVSKFYSVTIPVTAGDRLWATSFQKAGLNGDTKNGVRLTWFAADGVLESMGRQDTYEEFTTNGYLTAPEGAIAANVVMWDNSESNELYMLNRDHIYEKGICTACGAEHNHDWSDWTTVTKPSSDGPGMEKRVCSSCDKTEDRELNGVWQTLQLSAHMAAMPETYCSATNLWAVLEPESGYFKEKEWVSQYYSVTIPVVAGDQLWATSFQAAGLNGNAKNGVRLTWFNADGVLKSMSRDDTYGEFTTNGYLTAPEGAIAANVVMWDNSESNELYILNRDHIYEKGICTACGAEHDHDWSDWTTITKPSPDGPGMENRVCSSCDKTEERERNGVWQTLLSGHMAAMPEAYCSATNLWAVLEPESGYFKVDKWVSDYYSVTIPVVAGDQLWATSFQAAILNGNAKNGIRLTWFDADGVLKSMSRDETYGEFTANGYLTAPEGAIAANIAMWTNSDENEIYVLSAVHTGGTASCMEKAICDTCGQPYGEKDADSHTGKVTVVNAKDATCGAAGYTGDEVCECGKTVKQGLPIEATGKHTGGTATCMAKAVCEICEQSYGEKDSQNHSFTRYKSDKNATCRKNGTKSAKCDYGCGKIDVVTDKGSKLGHKIADGKCIRCGLREWNPETGDVIMIAVATLLVSGVALVTLLIRKKKK